MLNDAGVRLERILDTWIMRPEALNPSARVAAISAATKHRNTRCLDLAWSGIETARNPIDAKLAGCLARAATQCQSVPTLEAIINIWEPNTNTLVSDGHAVWGTLLAAAADLARPNLIGSLLRRMDEHSDPTVYKNRGTLDALLWSIAARQRDRAVAAEIEDFLVGLRVDIPFCLRILATLPPAPTGATGGRFEGAARCISKYLIGRYFQLDANSFQTELQSLLPQIFASNTANRATWIALLARGQEAYVGGLRRMSIETLEASLGYLESLSAPEIASEARRSDGVLLKVNEFLKSFAPSRDTGVELCDIPDEQKLLVKFLADNQQEYYRSRGKARTLGFLPDLTNLVSAANLELLSTSDSVVFFSATLAAISDAVWTEICEPLRGHVHGARNSLERVLEALGETDDVEHVAKTVKAFVRSLRARLFSRFLGDIIRMGLDREINYLLLGDRKDFPSTVSAVQTGLRIAAGKGARKEVIEPLFDELRTNAENALAKLPESDQRFEVSLRKGIDEDDGYLVLTVANAWIPTGTESLTGTGLGRGIIQRLARQFVQGDRIGYAVRSAQKCGETPMFTWRIYLPEYQADVGVADRA